jgi:predicted small metal-binding protein
MNKYVKCDCGWEFTGPEEDLILAVIDHGRTVHQMDVTREQALAQARPA